MGKNQDEKKEKVKILKKFKYKGLRFYNLIGSAFFITLSVMLVMFFVVNSKNKVDIYLIFYTFSNISVSTIILLSFLLGNISAFILFLSKIRKRKKKIKLMQQKEEEKLKENK